MSGDRILVIEDDPSVRTVLSELLTRAGYLVETAADGAEALSLVKQSSFQLHLIDYNLPSMSGLEVMRDIKRIHAHAVCIILTAFGTIELSVKAMKSGAFDFITKPFQVDVVLGLVKNALEYHRLKHENLLLQKMVREKYQFENMVGQSPLMQGVYELIERVADSDSTILIQGESGTGKEVVAKTLHFNSPRRDKPLIPVNCGAIPEALLESELFGHEKGAFTGAATSRIGRFELAHGGTLFLDEISELSLPLQVKLLRVLQERSFERVGGTKTIHVDVRIIAATNQDLEQAVEEKRFRKDLFYRLNVIPMMIPPLRERREDIPLLIDHFIHRFNEKKHRKIEGVTPDAEKLLLEYPWPGNIRELENLIERLVTLKQEGYIQPADLPDKLTKCHERRLLFQFELPDEGANFSELVSEFENQLLQQALLKANGVKNRAAQLLKMNRTTLVEKLKRRWSHPPSFSPSTPGVSGNEEPLSAANTD
ncbi:MAG: sigma-54-dependent Fis family transcriptional regulator [Candidatus Manganitrophaceae bacterium]|nr:MAG: sigma-54-dependent Fis family transcriptional regulator [Candidatus Manganitrophaceae bacterium]